MGAGVTATMNVDVAPSKVRDLSISIWRTICGIGNVVGPIIVGIVMDDYGIEASFLIVSILMLSVALSIQLSFKETRPS